MNKSTMVFKMRYNILMLICSVALTVFSQDLGQFDEVDSYIRQCPKYEKLEDIVKYINVNQPSEIEKARMIYVWLAENIKYNDEGYNKSQPGSNTTNDVLKTHVAVCEGYANVFKDLGEALGLEIVKVVGCAKGYSYEPGVYDNIEEASNHAWNAIKIDGKWMIYDATWGTGSGTTNRKGKLVSVKEFTDDWFYLDPKISIYSHFPAQSSDQYLDQPISFLRFEELPKLCPSEFKTSWLNVDEVLLMAQSTKPLDFAEYYPSLKKGTIKAPITRTIKKGKPYLFEIKSDEITGVYLVTPDEEWIPFSLINNMFTYTLNTKNSGEYSVVINDKQKNYNALLTYQIE